LCSNTRRCLGGVCCTMKSGSFLNTHRLWPLELYVFSISNQSSLSSDKLFFHLTHLAWYSTSQVSWTCREVVKLEKTRALRGPWCMLLCWPENAWTLVRATILNERSLSF
jgi:hypothetical protein